jgi:hypothetical protein
MLTSRRQFMFRASALAGAAALPMPAAAAEPAIAPAIVREDIAILVAAYRAMHPGLDRYLGADPFAALADAATERLVRDGATLGSMFLALARLTAAVRCGHSYPNPSNQRRAVQGAILDGRDRVPFTFRWLDGRMIVLRPLTQNAGVMPGQAIDAIDGLPVAELQRRLLPLGRADGANDAKRLALMEVDGSSRYASFDVYRPLVSAKRTDGTVVLESGGRRFAVPAMTEAERRALMAGQEADGGWSFAVDEGAGLLTMPNWGLYDSKWDWQAFLDQSFATLIDGRAKGLVIDLRRNEGGLDIGNAVLARLIDAPLPLPVRDPLVRYRKAPAALMPFLDTWDPSFADWGDTAVPFPARPGFFRLERDRGDIDGEAIQPIGPRFAGKVAVLVGPVCSSATFQFAEQVQASGRAILVGEPTGGNRRGINGGSFFFLRLPGSGLEVDLPLVARFPRDAQPDAGIAPDIAIRPSQQDIAAGRDPALEQAMGLVRA